MTNRTAVREANVAPEGAKKSTFRPDVQGLRAVAVVAVVLDHLLGWPRGGFIGVDLFFVISGYLITGLLLREYDKSGGISFTGFYLRRFKRIFPAATLVLLATIAAAWFLTPGDRFFQTAADAAWAALFAANWNMGLQGTDYFQADLLPSPLQHYWSLSVEEQFYFVWPWVILLVLWLTIKVLRGTLVRGRVILAVTIAVLSAASFAYGLFLTQTDPAWAYFSSFTRAWELGLGALVAILSPWVRMPHGLRIALSLLGLVAIGVALFVVDPAAGFPVPWAALPVLAIALVLVAGERGDHRHLIVLTNPVSRYIGNISYSLYLWHFPVLMMLYAVLPKGTTFYVVYGVLALGLSAASYHLVEDPLRRWSPIADRKRRRRRRGRHANRRSSSWPVWFGATEAITIAVGVIVVGGLLSAALLKDSTTAQPQSGTVAAAAPTAASSTPDPARAAIAACLGAGSLNPANSCATVDLGTTVSPAPAGASSDRLDACWIAEHGPIQNCHYGSDSPDAPRLALVGDSHAHHFIPGLQIAAETEGWSLDTYTGVSCLLTTTVRDACDGAQTDIIAALESTPYDVVLTSAARTKSEDPQFYADMFARLQALGTTVIVIADVPPTTDEGVLCYQRIGFQVGDTSCGVAQSNDPADPLVRAAELNGAASVIDLSDRFCSDSWCPAVVGNTIVYRDAKAHITANYARSLAPDLAERISAVMSSAGS
ncbi:MAG: hypothetical protein BGO45_03665 [Microbacterium sp. 71-36]|nr:MAG: hypothetical protein ABS60_00560 [Microbacterium sp. SCN 71-17]OJV74968.1 MAG: hypothetical protein BGO45_03665 [Microbacterium sp. 71-36]